MEIDARYIAIARDINDKILNGKYEVGQILRGRSLLASEYGVSPETIRKAINILEKEKIVEVKHGVGIFIDSKTHAKQFKEKFAVKNSIQEIEKNIQQLVLEKKLNDEKLDLAIQALIDSYKFQTSQAINFSELVISEDSWVKDHTIGDIYFWNYTEATIVAVLRNEKTFASPGPDFVLKAKDRLLLVGKDDLSYERALTYVTYGVSED